jgi:drug/metabolite transporter (DMT)-like permease
VTELALAASVVAMLVNSAASLLEAEGSRRVRPGRPLVRQPVYLGGLVLDALGWVLSVVALRSLPVVTVQSVLAGSVAVTTLADRRGRVGRLPARQLAAVAVVVVGLVLVAASAEPGRATALPGPAVPVLLVGAVAALLALEPVRRSTRALPTAFAAGLAFGGVALAVRAVHVRSGAWSTVLELAADPLAYAVVVFGLAGTLWVASALRAGAVGAVTAVLSTTQVVVPGAVGLVLLGDRLRPGWLPALLAGLVLTVGGITLLARRR